MKYIQQLSLIQNMAHPLLSPDLREKLLCWGIWSEAKYHLSPGSSRDTIQGGQLLQKVLVKSWVKSTRYFQTAMGHGQCRTGDQQYMCSHCLEHSPPSGVSNGEPMANTPQVCVGNSEEAALIICQEAEKSSIRLCLLLKMSSSEGQLYPPVS